MLAELAAAVRAGDIDPADLVEESLRRIDADTHNAVIRVEATSAREAAENHPRTGPLAGLPLLVKDMARCRGSVTTMGGSPFLAGAPTDDVDDVAVARLKAAGAIVVGRTNSPQYGHAAFSANAMFGATTNPWNPQRSPGGSSGGSSAARPSHSRPSRMTRVAASVLRSRSVSSMRSRNWPPWWRLNR